MNLKKSLIKYFLIIIILGLTLRILTNFTTQKKIETKPTEIVKQAPSATTPIFSPTSTIETKLPNHISIKTAFIKQAPFGDWQQPWQDACEEAALITVSDFYKNVQTNNDQMKTDILKMIDFETKKGWQESINTSQMAIIAQDYLGYKTKIISNPTINLIKKYLSQNIPVIVPADGKILFKENKYFSNGGPYYHNIVILGYDDSQNKFIVHDVGTQHGEYFQYSYNLIMDSIHDFPDSNRKEDIATGPKNILVLLK